MSIMGIIYLEGRGSLGNGPKMPPHGALIYSDMKHLKRYNQLFENQQDLSQEQKDWLDKCSTNHWRGGKWNLNPKTGLVDVDGNFFCEEQKLKDFKGVRFGSISEDFYCSDNRLTSLEGAPQSVGRNFDCSENRLTSLKGAPQSVGDGFYCSDNRLTSLEGVPQSVGGYFSCSNNRLTSLEGAPERVGALECSGNKLTSFKGGPKNIGGILFCENNEIASLDGFPESFFVYQFSRVEASGNPISERTIKGLLMRISESPSLEQAVEGYWKSIPNNDRAYLAKYHPNLPEDKKRGYEALAKFKGKII